MYEIASLRQPNQKPERGVAFTGITLQLLHTPDALRTKPFSAKERELPLLKLGYDNRLGQP
jgi:hypothetical protein